MTAREGLDPAGRPLRRGPPVRLLAYAGGAVLTLTYLEVLYRAIDVAGRDIGTAHLALVVATAVALGALVSRTIAPRTAVVLGSLLLAGGLAVYLLSVEVPAGDVQGLVGDTAALLTGLSILQVTRADVWALGLAPAPVFLTTYFLLRGAYGHGALAGCLALALFVLTGDAGTVQALVGVLGAAAAVGLGDLDAGVPTPSLQNTLAVVLVAMLVVTTSVSLVPGGEARPLLSGGSPGSIEASLTETTARVGVGGSIRLSPTVRFSVTAEEGEYWRIGAYDRYTGDAWVRTGRTRAYDGRLPGPEAASVERVEQTILAESPVSTMPAAWKPVTVESSEFGVDVTTMGGLQPDRPIGRGQAYRVTSLVARPSTATLRGAGTDYPAAVEDRYLQLPDSTPDRLGTFTAELTSAATNPYERAAIIERWLEGQKGYSLDVERPDGDIASSFVFEMDRGYCVYYATAMVAMLRTQGVPARFVVGYTTGQQVAEDRWVVRGLDSHAWVEVYFPDVGWVKFDPTPASPRETNEIRRIELARQNDVPDVDTNESLGVPLGSSSVAGLANNTTVPGIPEEEVSAADELAAVGSAANASGSGAGSFLGGVPTSPEALLYGVVLLLGLLTGAVRLGLAERAYRAVWLRRLPKGPPRDRIEAAVERAEYLLGRRHRPRRRGETRRAYVHEVAGRGGPTEEPATRLFHLGERARYAGRASEDDAATAARLLEELRQPSGSAS